MRHHLSVLNIVKSSEHRTDGIDKKIRVQSLENTDVINIDKSDEDTTPR